MHNKYIKTLCTVAFLLLITVVSNAQTGEPRNLFSIGVNGGMSLNSATFSPKIKTTQMMGYTGGFTARYVSEKYFAMICGAQIEVNYALRGWEEEIEEQPIDNFLAYSRSMSYIEIPFLAHLAFGKEQKGAQFFINLGPQVGFLLSESEKIEGDWTNPPVVTTEQHGKKADKKFDYGITGGLGVELKTKAGNFLLEGRYYFGLSDFYNSTKKDHFSRSAHNIISVRFSYLWDLLK